MEASPASHTDIDTHNAEIAFANMSLAAFASSTSPTSAEASFSTSIPGPTSPTRTDAPTGSVLSLCKQNQPQKALSLLYSLYPQADPSGASFPTADIDAIFSTLFKMELTHVLLKAFDDTYPDMGMLLLRPGVPTTLVYELVMSSCMKIDKPYEAIKYFNRLLKTGRVVPEPVMVLACNAFIKCNRLIHAIFWFEELAKLKSLPSEFTFNNLINALIKGGMLEEAFFYIHKIQALGIQPDQYTYNIIIKAHVNCGDIDSAREIMALMLRDGLVPDAYTYGPLLLYHANMNNPVGVVAIFTEMIMMEVELTKFCWDCLERGCGPTVVSEMEQQYKIQRKRSATSRSSTSAAAPAIAHTRARRVPSPTSPLISVPVDLPAPNPGQPDGESPEATPQAVDLSGDSAEASSAPSTGPGGAGGGKKGPTPVYKNGGRPKNGGGAKNGSSRVLLPTPALTVPTPFPPTGYFYPGSFDESFLSPGSLAHPRQFFGGRGNIPSTGGLSPGLLSPSIPPGYAAPGTYFPPTALDNNGEPYQVAGVP